LPDTPSLTAFRPWRALIGRQARDLYHRPDFDAPLARHRDPCGDADRLVEIPGVDQEIAAQLLARLRVVE
jgi:hypothetical protein